MAVLDTPGFRENNHLILFLKVPVKGMVKTRLAKETGEDAALLLYKAFITDLLATISRCNFSFTIFFHPVSEEKLLMVFPGEGYRYLSQEGGDLGEKMSKAFERIFAEGKERVILIGSDTIDISREEFQLAFHALREQDSVIGPSEDGGFYLIGFRREGFKKRLFRNIPWSTNDVFDRMVERLRKNGSLFFLPLKSPFARLPQA